MTETEKRISWESKDGKYKVLVRHFKGDPSPLIDFWKLNSKGKFADVRYKDLPYYVKSQMEVMKSQVTFNR